MLVVIAIMGLTAVLMLSHGAPQSAGARETATASEIVQSLRLARSRAIAEGTTATVALDAARHLLLLDGLAPKLLPPEIPLSLDPGDGHRRSLVQFRFAPDGSAQGGVIFLGLPPKQIRIAINWLSGAVETGYVR
jgi:general secretion pathway protein H